jgi:hypothetical protein
MTSSDPSLLDQAPAALTDATEDVRTALAAASVSAPATGTFHHGIVVGHLVGLTSGGLPLIELPGVAAPQPVTGRTVVPLTAREIGRDLVVMFEAGRVDHPIIMGLLQSPAPAQETGPAAEVRLDGEQLVFNADREIVLRCGKASITLTRAGKVLIRGSYLSSRSSGVNRIKGGSVQIN